MSQINNNKITFKALQDLTVYDNTSGSLVPFGVINKDEVYPAITIVGDWLQIDLSGRIGYVYTDTGQIITGSLAGRVIVLDAGHGGFDPGAHGKNNQEKALTLNTALEVANSLRQEGATVILTRETDIYLTLAQRVDISNQYKADAFISIHYNYFTDPSSNGIETYYYTSPKDLELANYVHQGLFEEVSFKDRGIRFGDFHVIRENLQPAILLELGFISNPEEEKVISTAAYYEHVAVGIANGLIKYFQENR